MLALRSKPMPYNVLHRPLDEAQNHGSRTISLRMASTPKQKVNRSDITVQ